MEYFSRNVEEELGAAACMHARMSARATSCAGGTRGLAAPPRPVGRPCPRFWFSAGTPGGSAPWPWAPGCWTACPCRSGAAFRGSSCPLLSRASTGRRWSRRACPWTGPASGTGASGLRPDVACTPSLAWLATQTPPSAAAAGAAAAGGAFAADDAIGPPVASAPSLALAANLQPGDT
jgi:hypothetical protein